ncbi:MAG TPA: autotransporter-associated beta strand repeat-containing protein [Pirellulales bacterium]|jgi:autotransporter-associated beta strand protein
MFATKSTKSALAAPRAIELLSAVLCAAISAAAVILVAAPARADFIFDPGSFSGGSVSITGSTGIIGRPGNTIIVANGETGLFFFNGPSHPIDVAIAALQRNVGGILDFTLPVSPGAVTVVNGNTDGILGGWATNNQTDWVTVNGPSPGLLTPLTNYSNDTWAVGNQTTVTTADVVPADATTTTLRFNAAGAMPVTLADTAGQTNTLTSGGILISPNVGAADTAIVAAVGGASLTSGNGQDVIVHQGNTLGNFTLGATIVDNGATAVGLTKAGDGTMILPPTVANTYTGPTSIVAGTLVVSSLANGGSPSAIGQSSNAASNFWLNRGALNYVGSGATTDRLFTLGSIGTLASSGAGPIAFTNSGPLAFTFNGASDDLVLAGTNTGNNAFAPLYTDSASSGPNPLVAHNMLEKDGAGTWSVTNANTFSGGTTINGGTLLAENHTGSAFGSGPVTVNAGGTLGGDGAVTGAISFIGGILSPGNGIGTLTLGATTFDAAAQLTYQLGAPNIVGGGINDLTEVHGNLMLNGQLIIPVSDGMGIGTYRLFDYTGTLTNDGFSIGHLPLGVTGFLDFSVPHQVNLDITAVPEPSTWLLGALGALLCIIPRRPRCMLPMRLRFLVGISALITVAIGGIASAAPVSMAVMGDSINLLTPTYDTSWVVQLQNAGAITAHDYAFDGATSTDVVNSQLAPVVSLAQQGQITDSVLVVGTNDIGPYGPNAAYLFLDGGDPTPIINTAVANIEHAISSIAAANPNVHQVIANLPDMTVTPLIQELEQGYNLGPAVVQKAIDITNSINSQIEQFALDRHIPVIDLFKASEVLTPLYPWNFGGHTFDTAYAGNGFDILTQPEGIISNAISIAFNDAYGQHLPIFSDQQIVQTAGFTPDSGTTYYDAAQFVITPEPSALVLLAIGALALMGRRRNNC